MGKGQQTATALNTFFQFWCYITPIFGAIVADQYLGKYRAILLFACIYFVGLVILTATSAPASIEKGGAFPGFIVSIIIIGLGTGGIKSNVSPLVAEQYQVNYAYVKTDKKGERVIVSPQATYQRIFNIFYWSVNAGSLSAIATTELEKNVGFWPAYLLPTLMFIPGILVVILGRKFYVQTPPRGSILLEAFKLSSIAIKVGSFEAAKPSNLAANRPELVAKAAYDDVFVDEFRRALKACVVFCWYPIYWLCYNQMVNNLISQAATMWTGNVPNDIITNIDPLFLIITIPIMDSVVYPLLRRAGFPMRPILRISLGFFFAAVGMAYTAGIQQKIYDNLPNLISAAYQIPSYIFIAFSEILASITGLEYAYKKAPQSMKSIVMSLFLFSSCVSSILSFALVSVSVDPKLTWMYTGIAATAFICSILVYFFHRNQDATDVEDDAIGRDPKRLRKQVEVEYEVEKSAV